jgi:hypothetical protein
MPTAQDLLQFKFSSTLLNRSADNVMSLSLNSVLDIRIDKLRKIVERIGPNPFPIVPMILIPELFKKFKNSRKNSTFDQRELRTLTYALNYSDRNFECVFNNIDELNELLYLLDQKWSDSFLSGLIDALLRNWETRYSNSLVQLEKFIMHKLDNYDGNRNAIKSFKINREYFNIKNGDLILGETIAKNNKPIQDATKFIGVSDSWFDYPYFSKVILTYYERNKNEIITEIDNFNNALVRHNNLTTNKRIISKIIIQAKTLRIAILQDTVKKFAFLQIGDPSISSKWAPFQGANDIERKEINEARNILNEWITQEFINVFFNVCINDVRRKRFWLQFASKISTFKVYGPLHTKKLLKLDERIAEFVDARFELVSSKRDVSAFILYIGEYMLIEFSNDGYAFYAYKNNSPIIPNLTYQLNSVDDLRNGSMPMAVQSDYYYDYFNDEGRLFHRDGNQNWETKFSNWMNKKLFA